MRGRAEAQVGVEQPFVTPEYSPVTVRGACELYHSAAAAARIFSYFHCNRSIDFDRFDQSIAISPKARFLDRLLGSQAAPTDKATTPLGFYGRHLLVTAVKLEKRLTCHVRHMAWEPPYDPREAFRGQAFLIGAGAGVLGQRALHRI